MVLVPPEPHNPKLRATTPGSGAALLSKAVSPPELSQPDWRRGSPGLRARQAKSLSRNHATSSARLLCTGLVTYPSSFSALFETK